MYKASNLDFKILDTNKNLEARAYWEKRLEGFMHENYFECPSQEISIENKERAVYTFHVPEQTEKALKKAAESDKAKHVVLLATLGILVNKYSSHRDIVIFTPRYSSQSLDKSYHNAIPIRMTNFSDVSFSSFSVDLRNNLIQDFNHSIYPLGKITNKNTDDLKTLSSIGMMITELQELSVFDSLSPDLIFNFNLTGLPSVSIIYKPFKFDAEYVSQIAQRYVDLLYQLIKNPAANIDDVSIVSEEEKRQLLYQFNNTTADYPKEETIISVFNKQVKRTPGNVALRYGSKTMTYEELDKESSKIAAYLQNEKAVQPGDLVGLMLERDEYLIPFLFAILKVGGVYVPIDPTYPLERKLTIISNAKLKLLIARGHHVGVECCSSQIDLDNELITILSYNVLLREVPVDGKSLAYVIYTSGSTGVPKGVMIEHHAVINRICWMQKKYPISASDVLLQKTPIVFDVSIWELFWWSFSGASLCLLMPMEEKQPRILRETIKRHSVTVIHFVPTMLSYFLADLKDDRDVAQLRSLRYVFCSGEALKPEQVNIFGKLIYPYSKTRLINLYGPTEATVDVSYFECDFNKSYSTIPIGKPIDNIQLYILNSAGQLVPIGIAGELCIGGVGVGRGYLGNESLTREKFCASPFAKDQIIYKTGDVARWMQDGNIQYLGRVDDQVKIRGNRIELGEIECQLLTHELITDVVVVPNEKAGEKFLVAYYISPKPVEHFILRSFLLSKLPDYMVPAYFVRIECMPLTSNGKLNRKALPSPEIKADQSYIAPSTELEEKLVEIWSDILVLDKSVISVAKSFFELGGNSLKLVQLNEVINETFGVELSMAEMFRYVTITSLVGFINRAGMVSAIPDAGQQRVSIVNTNKSTSQTRHVEPSTEYTGLEIAIIGMAGRFPGANNVTAFWDNLKNGIESISRLSDEELLKEGESKNLIEDPCYVKANAYIENKEYFDSDFFDVRPAEAKMMDPQLRIFTESCWSAIEEAGYDLLSYKEKIGLFAGGSNNLNWQAYALIANRENEVDNYTASQLRDVTFLCSRIAYLLDLKGPVMYVNTACSTSLVAVQRACMSLLHNECDMALAGGVTINNFSNKGYVCTDGMINSKDGHCRPFDADSSGTVAGEGCGVVVLKRLGDALKDGDNIHAVIKGSAVNNDGHGKISFTAPSVEGQYKVIVDAINMANIDPRSVSYIEAHGTGTNLGDPVEVEALNMAYGTNTEKYCSLGSVKSNVGHLDAAAGVAGLIKTVLALKHKLIPSTVHFKTPNPKINFQRSPFFVSPKLQKWKNVSPLRAGVSSFGIGGTNAHVILEEAPKQTDSGKSRDYQLLIFSAKTPTALEKNIKNIKSYLIEHSDTNLSDVAYTLQKGRVAFPYRKAFVSKQNKTEAALIAMNSDVIGLSPIAAKRKPFIVFMFPGQGSQYVNMCYDLYSNEPLFKEEVDTCFKITDRLCSIDFRRILFTRKETESVEINDTAYAQPLLFIVEYALARLLTKWGICPSLMIGHSIGEYVAACIAEVFSLDDALALVIKRGELMQQAPKGLMLSISISEEELRPLLNEDISLASVNSSELCVVSGPKESISVFKASVLDKKGYKSKVIYTSHAFHSHMMNGILDKFEEEVKKVKINKLRVPFISNLTGMQANDAEISQPRYWVDHLRKTVQFSEGVGPLLTREETIFIEIGPGNSLSTFIKSNKLKRKEHKVVNLVRHPRENDNDVEYLLTGIGELWVNGVMPDWDGFYGNEIRKRVSLPTYSFDKREYPVNVDAFKLISAERLLTKTNVSKWFYAPSWKLAPYIPNKVPERSGCTLIFADNCGIAEALVEKYRATNVAVITVLIGVEFKELSPTTFAVDPSNENDYPALFSCLTKYGQRPERIIHCWGVTPAEGNDFSEVFIKIYLYSVLHVIKCTTQKAMGTKEVVLLTSDLHEIGLNGNLPVTKSLALPLLKVVSQEYPTICTSHIDINLAESKRDNFIHDLYQELDGRESGKVVSFRNSLRWAQMYDRINRGSNVLYEAFKDDGVYLITGGLGALGVTLSKQLLKNRRNIKLILIGRTVLPPKSKWGETLTDQKTGEAVRSRISLLQSFEANQNQVKYFDCDLTNVEELKKVVQISEQHFGPLNGVIHAAGIVQGNSLNTIGKLTSEDFRAQFASKIKATEVLKKALEGYELDFCILVSSLSSVLGGIGFAAYASANIFMDYFIKSHHDKGTLKNWMSLNLDALDFKHQSTDAISAGESLEVFCRALTFKGLPQIIVSVADLGQKIEQWISRNTLPEEQQVSRGVEPLKSDAENFRMADLNPTERMLMEMWQNFFGKSEIDVEDSFFEIGGDSLKALTMIGRIQRDFKIELSMTDFFQLSSIRKLSEKIFEDRAANADRQITQLQSQEEYTF